jgi:Raf kinase inhibitor-like YbhB/YbcL family protein
MHDISYGTFTGKASEPPGFIRDGKELEGDTMEITSPAFKNGERVPKKYTCEGPNISPPLEFSDIPAGSASLVLMVEDPDAPAQPWVHWLVFNIPPEAAGFGEDAIAAGSIQGLCNGNTFGYEGPCPPQSEHQYLFRLYALDIRLDIPAASDRKAVLRAMQGHVLAEAVLIGTYPKATRKDSLVTRKEDAAGQARPL